MKIFSKNPTDSYEITFGEPNFKLDFIKIDTTYFSSKNESAVCSLKLKPGMNHIFGRIMVHEVARGETFSYYVYKDVYAKTVSR